MGNPDLPIAQQKKITLDGTLCKVSIDGDINAWGVQVKSGAPDFLVEHGNGGQIFLMSGQNQPTISLNGVEGNCQVGGR